MWTLFFAGDDFAPNFKINRKMSKMYVPDVEKNENDEDEKNDANSEDVNSKKNPDNIGPLFQYERSSTYNPNYVTAQTFLQDHYIA